MTGMDVFEHCAGVVRAGDRGRYLADLFAPEVTRGRLFALHAFDIETARVREIVQEPMLGEIRLQWWRDAIGGEAEGHPVAEALNRTIAAAGLPLAAFERFLKARVGELYDDPPATIADLEGHAGETRSALLQLGAIVLSEGRDTGTADLAGHAGVALMLRDILIDLGRDAARGRLRLPADRAAVHGLDTADLFAGKATPALHALVAEMRGLARRHLDAAAGLLAGTDPSVRPVFLPLALVEPTLRRMERGGFDPLADSAALPPWRTQWAIWRAARR